MDPKKYDVDCAPKRRADPFSNKTQITALLLIPTPPVLAYTLTDTAVVTFGRKMFCGGELYCGKSKSAEKKGAAAEENEQNTRPPTSTAHVTSSDAPI